jgi:hypothetical protein
VTVHRASGDRAQQNDLCSCMQAILASGQQGLRAMKACCSRFSTLKRQLSKRAQCLLCHAHLHALSSCRTLHPTHHLSSNNKEQSQADSLTYLIERAAVRHLPHWLCLLAATCAPPWWPSAPQIPVFLCTTTGPRAAFLTSQDL